MLSTKNYYEEFAKQWVEDAYRDNHVIQTIGHQRIQTIFKILSRYKNQDKLSILDLGCGGGNLCLALAQAGHVVTGIDQSKAMLHLAEEQEKQQKNNHKINFKNMSLEEVEDNIKEKFDIITCVGVMYYLPSDDVVFHIAKKLLKTDGLLIVSCRNKLFNVFNNSFMLQETIEKGEIKKIMQEIQNLSKNIPLDNYLNFIQAMKQMLEYVVPNIPSWGHAVEEQTRNDEEQEFKNQGRKILGRSHTPLEFQEKAKEHQSTVLQLYGIQPHFMFASTQEKELDVLNKHFAQCLTVFQELPSSLIWSSHFMAALKFVE